MSDADTNRFGQKEKAAARTKPFVTFRAKLKAHSSRQTVLRFAAFLLPIPRACSRKLLPVRTPSLGVAPLQHHST